MQSIIKASVSAAMGMVFGLAGTSMGKGLAMNRCSARIKRLTSGLFALVLVGVSASTTAQPAKLAATAVPVATIKNVSVEQVQNAVVGVMLPIGRTPVRQDANVMAYEFPLSFWQSIGVRMAQGNSGWQQPKGRQTFTMAQVGKDVMVTIKFETVATNMFNASNSIEINNPVVFNEQYLFLQLIAAYAEGRMVPGAHNQLGIQAYKKPTRKSKKVGAVIESLIPGGPAQQAGLMAGDVITHIGGVPTAEQSPDAIAMLGFLQMGEAKVQVQGKGEVLLTKSPSPVATNFTSPAVDAVIPTPPAASAPAASTRNGSGFWKKTGDQEGPATKLE
ncbi:MAG: PDZ domain-containing protein [Pseudoxanthomonas sp.]